MLVAQSCPTLCDPVVCTPPGSSVHGILLARILEWVASPFSRGSSGPRNRTQVSHIAGRFFTIWVTRELDKLFNEITFINHLNDLINHRWSKSIFINVLGYVFFPLCYRASLSLLKVISNLQILWLYIVIILE